ncbi:uncharacterized protein LOC132605646 [Lycium barbarum]|uniref:uncharacterized protein LOC132605646 n=1 Tax=Lycium barbarum TaxID=112863 RepID=UPI00293ED93B|nr:uncharacterized protein LOC132605646 [Lycium barbarum]
MFSGMLNRGNKILKLPNNVQNKRLPVLLVSLLFISALYLVLYRENGEKSGSSSGILKQNWDSFSSVVKLDPTVEFGNGTDIIWQIPDSPKAILFLAHGCDGKAANFWDKSTKCPNCVGLPEERLITLNALARKFAVIAVSSAKPCWSFKEERLIVKDIIEWWIAKQKLQNLPRVALGASSGGYFVSILATDLKFSSITVMIIEGLYDQMEIPESYPPTLFVHMPKDKSRMQKLERFMILLKGKGVDVAEVKCLEFPLFPNFFADRIPHIDVATSAKLFSLFQENGFVDKNGFMTNDGRDIRWNETLQEKEIILPDKSLVNHIQEEMNLAFAFHEMTSLQSMQIFNWFETHLS